MPLHGKQNIITAIANVKVTANNKLRRAVIRAFRSVIKETPVGNPDLWLYNHPTRGYIDYVGYLGKPVGYVGGRARNNWFLTATTPSAKTNDKTTGNDSSTVIKSMPKNILGTKIYLSNNLPYINALEYGHSSQAPEGWVRANVIRMQNEIRKI